MRKVVASVYSSLDGVIGSPEKWSLPYFNEQSAAYQTGVLSDAEVLIQGRATYDSFAGVWGEPSEDAFNHQMYEIPKVLVSRTVTAGSWHNTTVTTDPVATVKALKAEGDGLIATYGFGSVAYTLLDAGLLDEVHVWVHPVFARSAQPQDLLFQPGAGTAGMTLLNSTTLDTGVTILHYAVAEQG